MKIAQAAAFVGALVCTSLAWAGTIQLKCPSGFSPDGRCLSSSSAVSPSRAPETVILALRDFFATLDERLKELPDHEFVRAGRAGIAWTGGAAFSDTAAKVALKQLVDEGCEPYMDAIVADFSPAAGLGGKVNAVMDTLPYLFDAFGKAWIAKDVTNFMQCQMWTAPGAKTAADFIREGSPRMDPDELLCLRRTVDGAKAVAAADAMVKRTRMKYGCSPPGFLDKVFPGRRR